MTCLLFFFCLSLSLCRCRGREAKNDLHLSKNGCVCTFQMRKQLRTIAKRSNDKKARSPPVHGNHSALHQLPVSSMMLVVMAIVSAFLAAACNRAIGADRKTLPSLFCFFGATATSETEIRC